MARPIGSKFAKTGEIPFFFDEGLSLKKHELGILGGGQLARMMLPHCMRWNTGVTILDGESSVCRPFCQEFTPGNFKDSNDVLKLSDCKYVTLDLEAVSLEGLRALEEKGVLVSPSSHVIEIIQNKVRQKKFFTDNDLATAPYKVVDQVTSGLEQGFLKVPEGGYDGKGVCFFDGDPSTLDESFKRNVLWEERADIEKELSVIVARSVSGETKVYEPTEMAFDEKLNLISYTLYPARIDDQIAREAKALGLKVAEAIGMVGVLAIEMFLTKRGELWVNELAPRPHNSGHHTIESSLTSQFENHLRAVLGKPLGETDQIQKALTFNIIGSGQGRAKWQGVQELLAQRGVFIHNYGKEECKEGRKMGHVTILADTYEELIDIYHRHHDLIKVHGSKGE